MAFYKQVSSSKKGKLSKIGRFMASKDSIEASGKVGTPFEEDDMTSPLPLQSDKGGFIVGPNSPDCEFCV